MQFHFRLLLHVAQEWPQVTHKLTSMAGFQYHFMQGHGDFSCNFYKSKIIFFDFFPLSLRNVKAVLGFTSNFREHTAFGHCGVVFWIIG